MSTTGVTGIQDKLQEGVPRVIGHLKQAGLKLWMLTGDKSNTAYNVARACGLIGPHLHVRLLDGMSNGPLAEQIYSILEDCDRTPPGPDSRAIRAIRAILASSHISHLTYVCYNPNNPMLPSETCLF